MGLWHGAQVPIAANFRAFAQFEYTLGLTNIVRQTGDNVGETSHIRGAMLLFGAMLGF